MPQRNTTLHGGVCSASLSHSRGVATLQGLLCAIAQNGSLLKLTLIRKRTKQPK
jgi:hypothetical protein